MIEIENVADESCFPNLIFRKEIHFREDWVDIWPRKLTELWKCPIFDNSDLNRLTRYQKILSVCSLGCKNLLNFTWNTIKFHNCLLDTTQCSQDLLTVGSKIWRNLLQGLKRNKSSLLWPSWVLQRCRTDHNSSGQKIVWLVICREKIHNHLRPLDVRVQLDSNYFWLERRRLYQAHIDNLHHGHLAPSQLYPRK